MHSGRMLSVSFRSGLLRTKRASLVIQNVLTLFFMMRSRLSNIVLTTLRLSSLLFWLYVSLDKLWDLSSFHSALRRQPFPAYWADLLYVSLPVAELGIALLFILPRGRFLKKRDLTSYGFLLSFLLMLIFTVYIGLGILDIYPQRPCGCASIFKSMSWAAHFRLNLILLLLFYIGYRLSASSKNRSDKTPKIKKTQKNKTGLPFVSLSLFCTCISITIIQRFKMRFALFPASAGLSSYLSIRPLYAVKSKA